MIRVTARVRNPARRYAIARKYLRICITAVRLEVEENQLIAGVE
jgi:hypothetical protein